MAELRSGLLAWYDQNHRPLPWRGMRDPYPIWVSEIMSQQTRIEVVVGYWERWMERFPTLEVLAAADVSDVLAVWQGLGYYRRARLLQEGARWVLGHGVPTCAKDWESVPGVGPYTAGAIASICFGEASPAVDGNLMRVYARLQADGERDGLLARTRQWARQQIDPGRPGEWNQALMELGATVCRVREAKCSVCPLRTACAGTAEGQPLDYPAPNEKARPKELEQTIFLVEQDGAFAVRQIPAGKWWEGLWEFPHVWEDINLVGDEVFAEGTYVVTSHRIRYRALRSQKGAEGCEFVSLGALKGLAMPAVHRKLWKALVKAADGVREVPVQPALEILY